jgi:uncharacterized membrane protein YhaH (DUF805 family)
MIFCSSQSDELVLSNVDYHHAYANMALNMDDNQNSQSQVPSSQFVSNQLPEPPTSVNLAPSPPGSMNGASINRVGRLGYLLSYAYILLPFVLLAALGFVIDLATRNDLGVQRIVYIPIYIISVVYIIVMIYSSIRIQVRRLHDLNRSGWWILLGLVPLVGFVQFLFLLLAPGTAGPNKFGSVVTDLGFLPILSLKK